MAAEIQTSFRELKGKFRTIRSYALPGKNADEKTIESFGAEWNAFHGFSDEEIKRIGDMYFDIVTPEMLHTGSSVIDIGCGSGRFIKYLKGRFGYLAGIDPSSAVFAADNLVGEDPAVELFQASTDNIPFPDNHFDFGYSLGVLHHIPDTRQALNDSVKKIKPGGYFLLYLYYSLDNKSAAFKMLFHLSNLIRRIVSAMPPALKKFSCDVLAVLLYMPFVGLCRLLRVLGVPERIRRKVPLQGYEHQSFYVIRNDSLDRFGTPLEQRFSRAEIQEMMQQAGLTNIKFSENIPYWHATGRKK